MEFDSCKPESGAKSDYRLAVRSRRVDEAEMAFQIKKRAMFCILSGGQEVAQIASTRPLKQGDWIRGFYRSGTEMLSSGLFSVREMIAQVLGDSEGTNDPSSGGRMMGRHPGTRLLDANGDLIDLTGGINRASDVSCTGSQMPVALGLARASNVFRETPELASIPRLSNNGDEVVLVSIGDASMAEGAALEALSQAVVQRVPLIVHVLDNGYGISVPGSKQVPFGSISRALSGLAPQLKIIGPVNGWDYPAETAAFDETYSYVRGERAPALVHSIVTQPFGHSSSGDHRRYKSLERLTWEKENDCISRMRAWLLTSSMATEAELEQIEREELNYVTLETQAAWEAYQNPLLVLASELQNIYEGLHGIDNERTALANSLNPDMTEVIVTRSDLIESMRRVLWSTQKSGYSSARERLSAFHKAMVADGEERYSSHVYAEGDKSPLEKPLVTAEYDYNGNEVPKDSGAHIIGAGLATLMSGDSRIVCYGEDTGYIGGVTTCTLGLQSGESQVQPNIWDKSPALRKYMPINGFGENRVWDHAISEGSIVGGAVGMALRGLRPVAEIQYLDYVPFGLQQMIDEVACLRHRTDSGQECPMLIRTHGHELVGMWHSGSPMGMILSGCPGLRVLVPRNGTQAVGMYRAVLESRDPAFAVEPLQQLYAKEDVPSNLDKLCIPLGQSEILKEGTDLTVITYGTCCATVISAALELEKDGISVAVVDLQTLNPIDVNGVALASLQKTKNVLFVDEDIPNGAMAIVSKILLNERRGYLFVENIGFLTGSPHKPPYGKDGKFFGKPQASGIVNKICSMLDELDSGNRAAY